MTLETGRVATAGTLSFGGAADLVVADVPAPGALVRVPSVSSRVSDVPGFLDNLRGDPCGADEVLSALAGSVRRDVESAFDAGAAGILYWIEGASPTDFTPMQYGGLFLELDRAILEAAQGRGEVVVFVADPEEAYIDFVSDLPADLFGWAAATPEPAEIRALRPGRLLGDHPAADVRLVGPVPARRAR